jgi:hypothetical protein
MDPSGTQNHANIAQLHNADKNRIKSSPQISRARRRSVDQSSELSFQCTGELFHDESTWMKSPLCSRPKSRSRPVNWTRDMLEELDIESWLSDTSSCDGGEDIVVFTQDPVYTCIY